MAAFVAIMGALTQAVRRGFASYRSLKVNNFILFIGLLVYAAIESGVEPKSAEFLMLLFGIVLLFPLSSDPLHRIPPDRLALWPLTKRQRVALRMASLGLSPVLWLTVLLSLAMKQVKLGLLLIAAAILIQSVAVMGRQAASRTPRLNLFRYVPQIPGPLGGLIRASTRELFSVLDVYVAMVLSIGGAAYLHLSAHPDPHASPVIAILVGLTLSTYAQCLFGLNLASSGMTRYRLLPLRGWQILLAKGVPFLCVLTLLAWPISPAVGLTFGMTALAVGHHPSVMIEAPQYRWRFSGSRLFPGVVQAILGIVLAFAAAQRGVAFLAVSIALYAMSLGLYGWIWERRVVN
jgi:hypothetical protein